MLAIAKDSEKLKDAIEANGKSCSKTKKFPPFFSRLHDVGIRAHHFLIKKFSGIDNRKPFCKRSFSCRVNFESDISKKPYIFLLF